MPKQLNINLGFTADTSQARQQIQQLKQSLEQLSVSTVGQSPFSKMPAEVMKAQQSVLKLKSILDSSLNANTGQLDLSKFNQQLGAAGMSIQSLATDMTALGADGQKAFLNLANSIVSTQKPMIETNKLLDGMWTALKNTARWQLSSSLLHGFMGAIQGAYSYAQNLDESLTNIAIVTGRSREEMADFAEQANKSAQALSASTTAYTDAALIYYQQGLGDEDVQARTDATIKLANVTGQSAEQISSYMTAIWNNFAEGSENVEYFADVITALGAHTASSSEEIARGMQQFASVANTVGLSYEYAASALATIVAQTRQSETSVGNGLRTIFARLDSLKMGETLEDGVSLTKYTEALQKAGVEVLDQNGKLKDMNTILDEIGKRWQTLDETQKATLANTVGGVRQYSNLMALFDNWDQFKENVAVAEGSEGSLEGQAEIYAQSWEAAQKRVKAAWQAIYQDLIDSDFFIEFLNTLEKVLQGIDGFIDGVGGIPGVLSAVGVAITTLFGDKILAGIENAQQSLKVMTGVAKKESDYMVQQTMASLDKLVPFGSEDSADAMRVQSLKDQVNLNYDLKTAINDLAVEQKHLTDNQLEYLNSLISTTQQYGEAAAKAREYQEAALGNLTDSKASIRNSFYDKAEVGSDSYHTFDKLFNNSNDMNIYDDEGNIERSLVGYEELKKQFDEVVASGDKTSASAEKLIQKLTEVGKEAGISAEQVRKFLDSSIEAKKANEQAENAIKNYGEQLKQTNLEIAAQKIATAEGISIQEARIAVLDRTEANLKKEQQAIEQENQALREEQELLDANPQRFEEINKKLEENTQKLKENANAQKANSDFRKDVSVGAVKTPTENFNTGIFSPAFAKGVQTAFSGLSRLTMGLNSLGAVFDILNNKELEPLERVKKALPSLLMGLPMVVSGFTALGGLIPGVSSAIGIFNAAMMGGATATQAFSSAMLALLQNPATLWFIGIAAALVGLVLVIKSATDAWNADAKAAEEAAKKAEEAKQKYQEIRQEFNELKSSLENHQAAVNALKDLKQGTEEWYEAVQKLNEETLDLITKYPELAKYVENVDGSLRLNKDGMQEYLNAQYADLQKGYIDVINTQQEAAKTANQSSVTDTARSITYGNTTEVTTSTGTYQAGGKTASNEEILAAVEAFKANSEDFLKAGENLAEPTKAFTELLAEQGIKNAELVQALWDNRDGIATLSQELDANTESSQGLKDAYIQSSVQNEMGQQIQQDLDAVGMGAYSSDVQQYLVDQVSKDLADAEQWTFEAYQEALTNAKNNFEENKGQILDDIANKKSADMATTLSNNSGAQYSPEQVREYIESEALTDQEREIVIKYGIKEDSASLDDIKQSAIEKRQELKEAIEAIPVELDTDGLSKKQAAELQEEFANLTDYIKENATQIDELDDHLADCTKESSRVARAIIRFDDAVQDVTDNYEDWNKALKSGSMQAAAKAANEMQKAYGNLLDIDGSVLSSQFLEDADNLDLMKEAINGNEDAYQQLQEKANQDIIAHCDVDTTKFDAAMAEVQSHLDAMNFQELKIGADLDDGNFLQELSNLVNAAGMTAEQAEAYLANMGIDATVTEHETDAEETQETASFHPTLVPEEATGQATVMDGDNPKPVDLPYKFYGVKYEPDTDQVTTSKQAKNFTLEVTSAHKSSGGGFKYNQASHGGGGGGGGGGKGSCFAAGTLITTQNNYKNIEDIETGDIVLSYNEKTNKNEYSEVVQTMIHFVYEKIYNLFVKNEKITATGIHRFLITRKNKRKWIPASDLKVGDLVLLASGELQEISEIDTEVKPLTVYNFEVSNTHNYYVGETQILAHNKGGGGGGKAKKKKAEKPKEKKENIKEKDRYHNIKEQIEDLNTEMERLGKNKDRAYGKDRIKYMDQEIDRTKKQIGLTKEYIKEIKDYAKQDKAALEKTLKDIGMSDANIAAQFDENGVLKDYESLLEAIQDKFDKTATAAYNKAIDDYNKAVEVFNASDQEDAATEAFEKAKEELEKAEDTYGKQKDAYDKQLDSLKQYEDTMNLLQEKQQELIDQMNNLFDKALDIAREKIEIQLDVNDRDLKHLQWLYENIGDDADRVADRIANLSKQAEISVKNIKTNADGIRDIFSGLPEAYNGKDGKKLIDFSGINLDLDISNPEALINTVNQVVAKMREVKAEADIKTFLNDITKYEDGLMEEYRNLSDINKQITENMRDAFNDWRDLLEKNLDTNDHMQDLLQSYQDIAELLGQENMGISDEEMQQWRKSQLEIQRDAAEISKANWEAAKIARQKAKEEYDAAVASGNQLAIAQAKAMLEEAEDFEKDAHKEYLERVKETLRTAEEIYQQSLKNNEKAYQKALSGGIAPTLDRLQEQLDMQKELNHLHLDDYEKYKKLGDLQANINKQLANNPNVKVQGKLKGLLDDVNEKMAAGAEISEGEATILEKRLQLLQAEDQLMAARNAKSAVRMTRDNEGNFSYTYTADTSKIEEAQQNYADKFYDLLDYERKYSEDTQAAILQSYKEFLDKRNDIINDETLTNAEKEALLNQLEKDLQAKVQFYTDEMQMVVGEMGRLKNEDWQDMQQTLGRLLAEDDDFETSFEDTTLAKIAPAWNSAADAMKAFTVAAGQLKADDLQAIADLVNINEASMQNVGTSTLEFGKQLTDVYAQLEEKSDDAKEAAKEMAEETIPKYTEMINKGKEFSEKYGEYFTNVANNIDKVVTAIEKLRKSLAGIEDVGDVTAIFADALGESPEKNTSGQQFDTGGYTGSWGRSGKLAILHQKELVLNEKDTKNILEAVDILRSISGLNSNINVNNNIDYSGLANLGIDSLQQQVHIDASFPNVQSHNEIELALNNLINSASQYVNRKN